MNRKPAVPREDRNRFLTDVTVTMERFPPSGMVFAMLTDARDGKVSGDVIAAADLVDLATIQMLMMRQFAVRFEENGCGCNACGEVALAMSEALKTISRLARAVRNSAGMPAAGFTHPAGHA